MYPRWREDLENYRLGQQQSRNGSTRNVSKLKWFHALGSTVVVTSSSQVGCNLSSLHDQTLHMKQKLKRHLVMLQFKQLVLFQETRNFASYSLSPHHVGCMAISSTLPRITLGGLASMVTWVSIGLSVT